MYIHVCIVFLFCFSFYHFFTLKIHLCSDVCLWLCITYEIAMRKLLYVLEIANCAANVFSYPLSRYRGESSQGQGIWICNIDNRLFSVIILYRYFLPLCVFDTSFWWFNHCLLTAVCYKVLENGVVLHDLSQGHGKKQNKKNNGGIQVVSNNIRVYHSDILYEMNRKMKKNMQCQDVKTIVKRSFCSLGESTCSCIKDVSPMPWL